jgi:hypothetical protein
MPTCGSGRRERLGPHYRYFEARCRAKGATKRKAEQWAWQHVRRGKRAPGIPRTWYD